MAICMCVIDSYSEITSSGLIVAAIFLDIVIKTPACLSLRTNCNSTSTEFVNFGRTFQS